MSEKRILFIAYFFEPFKGVGAQRVSYWAKNINQVDPNIVCDVITATPQGELNYTKEGIRKLYYIPNSGSHDFVCKFIKDEGFSWQKDIKDFFNNKVSDEKYDVIIITGGPFMHFSLAKYFKQKFNSKIILDFRDPFSNNPRFGRQMIKSAVKGIFERKFIKNSDYVVTVNEYCARLMPIKDFKKVHIIDNGYDERALAYVKKDIGKCIVNSENNKIRIVYAGSFYQDSNLINLINAINMQQTSNNFEFHHIGKKSELLNNYKGFSNIIQHGYHTYGETLNIINSCEIGLILTDGSPQISTTKIFDYIGLEKPILIIADGKLETGNIHLITKDYPMVFWCKNTLEDIKKTLLEIAEIKNMDIEFKHKYKYSREFGLKKLIKLINS